MTDFVSVPVDEIDPIARAFDDGASLRMDVPDEPSDAPRPPTGTRRRGRRAGTGTRPAGSDELGNLAITGLILLVSFGVGDWAAPTADEGKAIAVPLGNILARRIDLAAKLGKDAGDTVALTIAVTVWLARVGPEGIERGRTAYRERAARIAADRVDRASIVRDSEGAYGVDVRSGDGVGTTDIPTRTAFDVDAEARSRARRGFARDLPGVS